MERSPSEIEFFRKLYFIRLASMGVSGFAVSRCLSTPTSVITFLLLLAIAICVGQLVAHLVLWIGFRIWLRKFRPNCQDDADR